METKQYTIDEIKKELLKKSKNASIIAHKQNKQLLPITRLIKQTYNETDFEAIAQRLSDDTVDATSKYFNKSKDEILEMWRNTSNKGTSKGKFLDTYFSAMFKNDIDKCIELIKEKPEYKKAFIRIHKKYESKKSMFVDSQVWLTSLKHNVRGVCDSIFYDAVNNMLYIFDLKSYEKDMNKNWNNEMLLNPFNKYTKTDLHIACIQLMCYKYILLEYGILPSENIKCIVNQINNTSFNVYDTDDYIKYDNNLIEILMSTTHTIAY